jgi:hypothetical protein
MRFSVAHGIVKTLATGFGLFVTVVSFMSLVGLVTGSFWVRFVVALVVSVAIPAIVVDRTLPKQGGVPSPGLATDVFALVVMGFALLYAGLAQPLTGPLLVREADRFAADGMRLLARVVYWIAGVTPVDTP